jgi:hypothetical protein
MMEILLAIILFAIAFSLLSVGFSLKRKTTYKGCCSSKNNAEKAKTGCASCACQETEMH